MTRLREGLWQYWKGNVVENIISLRHPWELSTSPLNRKPMTTAAAESSTKESLQKWSRYAHRSKPYLFVVALSVLAGHRLENETDYRETSRWHTVGTHESVRRKSRLCGRCRLLSCITRACNTSLYEWQRSRRSPALGSANRRRRGWGLTPQMQTGYNWMGKKIDEVKTLPTLAATSARVGTSN